MVRDGRALDQDLVRSGDAGGVIDPQRGGGIALRVQIEDQDVQTAERQSGREVHRGGGLADATLLVGDHEHPGGAGLGQGRARKPTAVVRWLESGAGGSATSPVSNSSRSNFARRGPGGLDTGAGRGSDRLARADVSRETSAWRQRSGAAERATSAGERRVARSDLRCLEGAAVSRGTRGQLPTRVPCLPVVASAAVGSVASIRTPSEQIVVASVGRSRRQSAIDTCFRALIPSPVRRARRS